MWRTASFPIGQPHPQIRDRRSRSWQFLLHDDFPRGCQVQIFQLHEWVDKQCDAGAVQPSLSESVCSLSVLPAGIRQAKLVALKLSRNC